MRRPWRVTSDKSFGQGRSQESHARPAVNFTRRCLMMSIPFVFDTDEASYLAECIRLRGQIAAGRGDVTRAAHLLETAIATARRQQARLFELRAATQLAPVLARQGRAHEAATRLQAVVHTFNTRYSIVDLFAAQRALDTLGQ